MSDGPEARRVAYLERELRELRQAFQDIDASVTAVYNKMPDDAMKVLLEIQDQARNGRDWCDMLTGLGLRTGGVVKSGSSASITGRLTGISIDGMSLGKSIMETNAGAPGR